MCIERRAGYNAGATFDAIRLAMTPPPEEPAGRTESAATAAKTTADGTADPVLLGLRISALSVAALGLLFVFNGYLIFWRGWPGVLVLFQHLGLFGLAPLASPLEGGAAVLGWIQLAIYVLPVAAIAAAVIRTPGRSLHEDAEILTAVAAYIARAAFWAVLLVGLVDMVISFLRVEGLLGSVVGEALAQDLGRSNFRGSYVHYPLIGLSLVIAGFYRGIGFTWLALLIVIAELQIVLARFIFSYEQAFMADLVRFWYGALFLFASAYTLVHQGHVRVDILYTSFSERGKARTNCVGSLLLGIPLCWVILTRGMWGSTNVIVGPLLNFEVTQSGFGLYVKYFMAGFLLVYALSMLAQFSSYFLSSAAILMRAPGLEPEPSEHPAEI